MDSPRTVARKRRRDTATTWEFLDKLCHQPESMCGQCAPGVRPEIEILHQERSRMGRELHDSTAQSLVALQLKVSYLREVLDDSRYLGALTDIEIAIHELHREIRAVSFISSLPSLKPGMLPTALRAMSERFGRLTGLDISFNSSGSHIAGSASMESSVYRIAQEVLANVFRHAKSRVVQVRLESEVGRLRLVIDDDGIGIRPKRGRANASGVGLDSIRLRVRELGGRLDFRRLKRGSRFTVTIPRADIADLRFGPCAPDAAALM